MDPVLAFLLMMLAIAIAFVAARFGRVVIAFIAAAFAAGMAYDLVKGFSESMGF